MRIAVIILLLTLGACSIHRSDTSNEANAGDLGEPSASSPPTNPLNDTDL